MKALILCAGIGKRFNPFSYYRPKPLFPIANKPLIEYTVKNLVKEGIKDIGIVVGHRGGRIKNYFRDGKRWGCKITYIEQAQPQGTGDAVIKSRKWAGEESFLVVYGDVYFSFTSLHKIFHEFKNSSIGVAAIEKSAGEGGKWIAAETKGEKIINYHWKDPSYSDFPVFSGLYAFKKEIWHYLSFVPEISEETGNGIFPLEEKELAFIVKILFSEGKPLKSVEIEMTVDMDFPWQPREIYKKVVKEWEEDLRKTVVEKQGKIERDARIEGNIYLGENSVIRNGTIIHGPVWIGENTAIENGTEISPYTVIGNNCIIGPFAQIDGCIGNNCSITHCAEFSGIILDESYLTHYCEIRGILGERSEIGAGTLVGTRRFDDKPNQVIVEGIKHDIPEFSGVLFGDYSRTGVGAMLMPGRIIGPSAIVGSGVILMKNVEPFTMVRAKQEQEVIPWRKEIYDK